MELLGELAGNGLLGLLLAISLSLNFMLGKMLLSEKDKRGDDARESRDSIGVPLAEIRDSLSYIERKIRVSKDE